MNQTDRIKQIDAAIKLSTCGAVVLWLCIGLFIFFIHTGFGSSIIFLIFIPFYAVISILCLLVARKGRKGKKRLTDSQEYYKVWLEKGKNMELTAEQKDIISVIEEHKAVLGHGSLGVVTSLPVTTNLPGTPATFVLDTSYGAACVVGALLLGSTYVNYAAERHLVASRFGITPDQVHAMEVGYEGWETNGEDLAYFSEQYPNCEEWFAFGKYIADTYCPLPEPDEDENT